jgi:hypothetical protein
MTFRKGFRLRSAASLVLFAVGFTGTAAGQTFSLLGTWTLNLSKSNLAGPPPRTQTVTFQPSGPDGVTGIEDTIDADGKRTTIRYMARLDGRDYQIAGPPEILAQVDAISMTRTGAATIVWSYKKNGLVALTLSGSLSADGKALTMTASGSRVLVYEKR